VLPLQNRALALLDLAGLRARVQNRTDSLVKDALQVSLGQGRALKVLVGADFLGANKRLLVRHRLHALLAQGLESSGVLTEIELGADKDDGNVGGVMFDLGMPLCLDVVERRRADDGKADQEDIGLGVRKRAKSVIIFLAGRIPKTETDRLAIDHNAGRVVVKDCGDVLAGEGVGGVGDEQTCLADSTVACYDTLERLDTCLLSHCCGLRRIKEQRRLGFFCGWEMELEMGIGREVRM
jgi:hypothetical protein